MKYILIFTALSIISFLAQAKPSTYKNSEVSSKTIAIAERLANTSINDILQIVLRLQAECQQKSSLDVCQGVTNIIDVLHYRVSTSPDELSKTSVAFIEGLVEGVEDANSKMIIKLTGLN